MTRHYFQIDKLEPKQEARLKKVFLEPSAGVATEVVVGSCGSSGGSRTIGKGGRAVGDLGCFTPAVVEQVASEHETVDEFIAALEARV